MAYPLLISREVRNPAGILCSRGLRPAMVSCAQKLWGHI